MSRPENAPLPAPTKSYERALRICATWIVEDLGYPFDFGCDIPPPRELQQAILDYCHADPVGRIHGGTLSREECDSFVTEEAKW